MAESEPERRTPTPAPAPAKKAPAVARSDAAPAAAEAPVVPLDIASIPTATLVAQVEAEIKEIEKELAEVEAVVSRLVKEEPPQVAASIKKELQVLALETRVLEQEERMTPGAPSLQREAENVMSDLASFKKMLRGLADGVLGITGSA